MKSFHTLLQQGNSSQVQEGSLFTKLKQSIRQGEMQPKMVES